MLYQHQEGFLRMSQHSEESCEPVTIYLTEGDIVPKVYFIHKLSKSS